jgi:hypothetical protein
MTPEPSRHHDSSEQPAEGGEKIKRRNQWPQINRPKNPSGRPSFWARSRRRSTRAFSPLGTPSSYLHGEFANNLWQVLGVNAITKETRKTTEATQRPAQRPVLNA